MTLRIAILAGLIAVAGAGPAVGQNAAAVASARQAGLVGERYDGYLGITGSPPVEVRRQVAAVNLRRRNLYIGLATRRQVAAQVVGIATACELLARVRTGEFYMLADGVWRKRVAAQAVPLPAHCGK